MTCTHNGITHYNIYVNLNSNIYIDRQIQIIYKLATNFQQLSGPCIGPPLPLLIHSIGLCNSRLLTVYFRLSWIIVISLFTTAFHLVRGLPICRYFPYTSSFQGMLNSFSFHSPYMPSLLLLQYDKIFGIPQIFCRSSFYFPLYVSRFTYIINWAKYFTDYFCFCFVPNLEYSPFVVAHVPQPYGLR